MAITHTLTNTFLLDMVNGDIDWVADTFNIALYTDAADLNADTTTYSSTGETSGAGYGAGGQEVIVSAGPDQSGGTVYISFADASWAGASFTARGALIYRTVSGNPSVAVLSFGENKTVSGGTFTVDFPPHTSTTALIKVTGSVG